MSDGWGGVYCLFCFERRIKDMIITISKETRSYTSIFTTSQTVELIMETLEKLNGGNVDA